MKKRTQDNKRGEEVNTNTMEEIYKLNSILVSLEKNIDVNWTEYKIRLIFSVNQ